MKNLKQFYHRYKHGIPLLLYMSIYLSWFCILEKTVTKNYTVIHVDWDDYIPFCEIFVVPYLLWFAYVTVVVGYLFFKDKQNYYSACIFLSTGMTIFLIISTLWPNGHHLRLEEMPRDNIFTHLVAMVWSKDTSTNLWPSIHVYNSLAAHFAIIRCKALESKKGLRIASFLLATSIVLSTVLIKQHSLFDVFTAIALGAVMYVVVYKREALSEAKATNKHKRRPQVG